MADLALLLSFVKGNASMTDIVLACGLVILYVRLGRVEKVISTKLENGIAHTLERLTEKVDEMHGFCTATQRAKELDVIRRLETPQPFIRQKGDDT